MFSNTLIVENFENPNKAHNTNPIKVHMRVSDNVFHSYLCPLATLLVVEAQLLQIYFPDLHALSSAEPVSKIVESSA